MDKISGLTGSSFLSGYNQQYVDILFPPQQTLPPGNNPFYYPASRRNQTNDLVAFLLSRIQQIRNDYIQYQYGFQGGQKSSADYSKYLQFPNRKIGQTADSIVNPGDSNDEKAYRITQWVIDNIEYQSDIETYGREEYWAYPAMTMTYKAGDCEDGAFLIHSLMLNAGVPPERIRTYGGYVSAGAGARTGGHGWTAYRRETDDEWVVLDWCYFPSRETVDERIPMKEDAKYIDDYFFVMLTETIETPYSNKVRHPAVGNLVDMYA